MQISPRSADKRKSKGRANARPLQQPVKKLRAPITGKSSAIAGPFHITTISPCTMVMTQRRCALCRRSASLPIRTFVPG